MKISLLTIGTRPPKWVQMACEEYQKRLPKNWQFSLKELPHRTQAEECQTLLKHLPEKDHNILLDIPGKPWSTLQLSQQLDKWQHLGKNLNFIIAGPDGADDALKQQVHQSWSLGPLTLPHPMARIVVIEQLYRAWSILQNHPYHRE